MYITRLSWCEGPKHLRTYYNCWYVVLFTAPVLGSVFDLFIKSLLIQCQQRNVTHTHTHTHNSLWNNMAFFQWLWYKGISHLIEAYENASVTKNILQWICICFGLTHWNGPAQSFGKSFGSDALYQRWRVACQSMDGFPGVPLLGLFWGKKTL